MLLLTIFSPIVGHTTVKIAAKIVAKSERKKFLLRTVQIYTKK